jgi:hypothetical protein
MHGPFYLWLLVFLFSDLDFRGTVGVCVMQRWKKQKIRIQICYFKGTVEFDLF